MIQVLLRVLLALASLALLAYPGGAHDLGAPATSRTYDSGFRLDTWIFGRAPARRQVIAIVNLEGQIETVIVRFEEPAGAPPPAAAYWERRLQPQLADQVELEEVTLAGQVKLFALGPPDAMDALRGLGILPRPGAPLPLTPASTGRPGVACKQLRGCTWSTRSSPA